MVTDPLQKQEQTEDVNIWQGLTARLNLCDEGSSLGGDGIAIETDLVFAQLTGA